MIFNSIVFLFLFLPISLLSYILTPVKYKSLIFLILSLVFFSFAKPTYLILILISMFVNYYLVLVMGKTENDNLRQLILLIIVLLNISLLFVFKYLGFFIGNINALFGTTMYIDKLIAPLGLSFYTFQVLSYAIDVYNYKYKADKNIKDVFLYYIMFPQLASGPIMRYDEVKPQMGPKLINKVLMATGIERFIFGLFKKVVIANSLVSIWTFIKSQDTSNMSVLTSWVGIVAFTLYIYFDFSGYMDMALGVANLFGYRLRENFNYPYISKSVSEFWRRWHITLGRWFKDYIYIPLGGSKNGNFILVFSTLVVWFTTGLWHGASWNFIFWGMYFGAIILLEKFVLKSLLEKMPSLVSNLYTMIIVIIGWVFFDTESLTKAFKYIATMFGYSRILIDNTGIYYLYSNIFYFILGFIFIRPLAGKIFNKSKQNLTNGRRWFYLTVLIGMFILSIAFILNQSYSPSMYIGF